MERQKNCLLVKSGVGQPKPFTHDLPAINHTYGKKNRPDHFNAGSLLSSWNNHATSLTEIRAQDFSKINKIALLKKVTDPKSLKEMRKDLDVKVKARYESRPRGLQELSKNVLVSTLFGKKNRPSTPIKGLICGDYGTATE